MQWAEAVNRLEASGLITMVSLKDDSPVELLFWDSGLGMWNSYSVISPDGEIEADAADSIVELY